MMTSCHKLHTLLQTTVLLAFCGACFAGSISEAKRDTPNGYTVSLQGVCVTAVFPGSIYVEQPDRCAGIRVDTNETLAENDIVDVEGVIETDDLTDERHVDAFPDFPKAAEGKLTLRPLGLTSRAFVGGDAGFQKGIPGDGNLNTIGLLVTTWGPVSGFDDPVNPRSWLKVGDAGGPEIKVVVPSGVRIEPDFTYVSLTGICSVEKVNGEMIRVLRIRRASDIVCRKSWATDRLVTMSLDEKIGQLFQVRVTGDVITDTMRQLILSQHVGGVVYFQIAPYSNLNDPVRSAQLSNDLQTCAMGANGIPLLISMDQEGGRVTRITGGCDFPGNMALGASRSTDLAYLAGSVFGSELKAVGANMDLAPVVDVNDNPANPVIGVRSFGEQPDLVSPMGQGYLEGLHSAGAIATCKHFPGHGDTATDSHSGLPIVTYDRATLDAIHARPFREAVADGVDCIMTAHILVTCLDPNLPATLSPAVMTDYLRNTIGFNGVCMTDSMGMGALASLGYTNEQECAMAIQAGIDLVSLPNNLTGAIAAVQSAVSAGTLTESRIDQSVVRILRLKHRYGLFANPYVDANAASGIVGSAAHRATELSAAKAAMTLVQNTGNILPLSLTSSQKVLLVTVQSAETTTDAATRFAPYIIAKHSNTQSMAITESPSSSSRTLVKNAAAGSYVTIIGTSRAQLFPYQVTLVNDLVVAGRRVIVVGLREPYELASFPGVSAYLAAYNYRNCGFAAAADVIFGDYNPGGLLPVTIPGLYAFGHGLSY